MELKTMPNPQEHNKKTYEYYEKEIIDIDELIGTDIKINPDYYIHTALLKAQAALMNDNMKEGFVQYRQFIEHIEVLCDAANMLPKEYDEKIKEFKNSKNYRAVDGVRIKSIKLADKKLNLIMTSVFNRKISTQPLKA